jgi:hypothetical protein
MWMRFPNRRIVSAKVRRADGTLRAVPFRRFRTFAAVGPLKIGERLTALRFYDANGRVVTP